MTEETYNRATNLRSIIEKEKKALKYWKEAVRLPRLFNGERLPSFTDEVKYFIKYKKHWWQRYRYMKNRFGRPMGFDSIDAAKEYLKKKGIDYKGKA